MVGVCQRVIAGAICPNFNSYAAQDGAPSQDGSYLIPQGLCGCHGFKATAGWRFGNLIDGTQAEYVLVPDAQANLAPIPDGLTDEQVLMCPDIMSTGFSGAESGGIKIGDTVAVFAQGPIGLCATAGARLMGATTIIGVETIPARAEIARRMGADHIVDFGAGDVVDSVLRLTDGRGVDVAIEALGRQETFEAALRVLRPGGTLSSLGVYSTDLKIPLDAFSAGLGDHTIVTTLCPGGKERMRRLMDVIAARRVNMSALVTHHFKLDDIEAAYELTPDGETRRGIAAALRVPFVASPAHAARVLGNGSRISAPDTVPVCLWLAARHLDDYREALWATASIAGDIDTNCAIVGGIVALSVGREGIPAEWLAAREPIPFQDINQIPQPKPK